jgi:sigma-B regulation protein RsbU (phosphoserine phosphatase)
VPYTSSRRQNCALCYVQLDRNTLAIVNAGGIPPYIRRQNGHVEWPSVCGFALGQGLGAQVGYQETSVVLNNGDLVVLTSDGVVEAANSHGEMFGFERLQEAIANGPLDTAQEMLNHLLQTVADFVNGINPHDDMTIVVFRLIR